MSSGLVAASQRVGQVAARHADDVDQAGRFPSEALAALRDEQCLRALVPLEQDGGGAELAEVAQACTELGRRCAATGMVFAMHAIQVLSIARHLDGSPWFEGYLARLAGEQRLVASVTSEVGTGGDMGSSVAALTLGPDGLGFTKRAPTISYGAYADDLLTTLRREPSAERGDQVAVLTLPEQHRLEPTGSWDVLGMRGTCSSGFVVHGCVPQEQVLGPSFADVSSQSMVPVSHVLWSHLWLGIATDAFVRARDLVRDRKGDGAQLTRTHELLMLMRSATAGGLAELVAASAVPGRPALTTMAAALRFNTLKLTTSELAPQVCLAALSVCGIAGFRNDGPANVGRHLRDSLSGALMVANDRVRQSNAQLLQVVKEPW